MECFPCRKYPGKIECERGPAVLARGFAILIVSPGGEGGILQLASAYSGGWPGSFRAIKIVGFAFPVVSATRVGLVDTGYVDFGDRVCFSRGSSTLASSTRLFSGRFAQYDKVHAFRVWLSAAPGTLKGSTPVTRTSPFAAMLTSLIGVLSISARQYLEESKWILWLWEPRRPRARCWLST